MEEQYNLCNVTFDELKNEVVRYLANIENRKSSSVNKGIHNKISSKNLYQIFQEVNIGLERIESPLLTEREIIEYLELPFEKAVIFLDSCLNLTEEEIKEILISNYPNKKELINKKTIEQLNSIIEDFDIPEIDLIEIHN